VDFGTGSKGFMLEMRRQTDLGIGRLRRHFEAGKLSYRGGCVEAPIPGEKIGTNPVG
jgi:hypothetical protein